MDKVTKKKVKKVLTWVSLALVVALLSAMPLIARQEAEADGPVASILSAEVTRGTIASTLHGGGNIAAENVENVKIPSGVKIEGFLVKNGQFVTEGTPLARVDKVSVMTAITEVSETLEFLREELENARNEKIDSAIQATAGGRVKKIFAQKGESVQEVMLRDGCLAVLSLDGMMAVKLEQQLPLTTGESVTVTLADGSEITGRVESNLDGVVIITVEDEGYEIGQTVTVAKDGEVLGEGELYIHNAWKVTAYTGTIETVNAKEEKTLHSGATIFTLTDRDYEGELRHRASQHRQYEELLQELFQMYESGVITAPCNGEVEGVDNDSPYLLSATPEGWVLAPLNNVTLAEEKPYRVLLLSQVIESPTGLDGEGLNTEKKICDGTVACPVSADLHSADAKCFSLCEYCAHKPHSANCLTRCTGKPDCPNANDEKYHHSGCQSLCTGKAGCLAPKARHKSGCPEKCTNNAQCKSTRPKTEHDEKCIIHCVRDVDAKDLSIKCDAKTHYPQCIENCVPGKTCTAINHKTTCYYYGVSYTACVGIVKEVSGGTVKYKYAAEFSELTAVKDSSGKFTITVKPDFAIMNKEGFVASGTSCNPGDVILIVTGHNDHGDVVVPPQVHVYQSGAFDMSGIMGGMMGGLGGFDLSKMIGGFYGFGNYSAAAPEDEGLFDLEGDTLLTVTAHDTAKLVVAIDEHDIAKVTPGMKATVKVEALKGEEFPAEITNVSVSGSNSGGSSKFSVELTLPMSENMLSGMSASAVIPLEEKSDVLLIPAAALVQQGAKTVVYTALDKEGNPASPVAVQTGLTDGENVEILSGLTEGQKIYYSYYDTVELDTSAEADRYTLR